MAVSGVLVYFCEFALDINGWKLLSEATSNVAIDIRVQQLRDQGAAGCGRVACA
jgi:hypothetical protein